MINSAMFTSNTNEWATPQAFFDELNKEFTFTLDPCATPQNAKCARYFTKEIDGLAQSWRGETVFCNPPYGRDLAKWVAKAHAEVVAGGGGGGKRVVWFFPPARGGGGGGGGGGYNGCHAYSRPHGYGVFSRLHIQKTCGTVYPRTVALQRKQIRRALSVNGCRYASVGYGRRDNG